MIDYRGSRLEDMDLEAVIRRHPKIALVDELAHTNVPGSGPHEKRWQDVLDLLAAGIGVITTLNPVAPREPRLTNTAQRATGRVHLSSTPGRLVVVPVLRLARDLSSYVVPALLLGRQQGGDVVVEFGRRDGVAVPGWRERAGEPGIGCLAPPTINPR